MGRRILWCLRGDSVWRVHGPAAAGIGDGCAESCQLLEPHVARQWFDLRKESRRYAAHATGHMVFRPFRGDSFTFICLYVNTVFKLVTFI